MQPLDGREALAAGEAGHPRRQHAAVEATRDVPAERLARVLLRGPPAAPCGISTTRRTPTRGSWASARTSSATAIRSVDEAVTRTIGGRHEHAQLPGRGAARRAPRRPPPLGRHGTVRPVRRRGVCHRGAHRAAPASGRSGVAICGYHGWSDWYLAANLAEDDALDGHLLPGLEPKGVPRHLTGSVRPFVYNDLESLERVVSAGDVGVVFMEVTRSSGPEPGFLEGVRRLATEHAAVLVFDECTSGFRRALGGIHLDYGVDPDVAVFGKTLGNGYAITAVIGRREVMDIAAGDVHLLDLLDRTHRSDRRARPSSTAWPRPMPARWIDEIGRRAMAIMGAPRRRGRSRGDDLRTPRARNLRRRRLRPDAGEDLRDPIDARTGPPLRHCPLRVDRGRRRRPRPLRRGPRASAPRSRHVRVDDELSARLPDGPAQAGFRRLA